MYFDDEQEPCFQFACKLEELEEGRGKLVVLNEVEVAVFKVKHEVFAIHAECPHHHTIVLQDGFLERGNVVCPAHGWKFSLKTGKQPDGRRGVDCYEVNVREGDVFVKAVKKKLLW